MKGNEVTDITLIESKHNELHDAFLEIFQGRSDAQVDACWNKFHKELI